MIPTPPASFGLRRHLALSSYWFGMFFMWTPMVPVVIVFQLKHLMPQSVSVGTGLITALGAIPAMALPPLVGMWSDGLVTRWGRRRPLMVAGTLVNVVGLLVMMVAPNFPTLVVGFLAVQVSNNTAGAAFNGIVPDVVPKSEFGRASGMLGAMVQFGSLSGSVTALVVSLVTGSPVGLYAVMAVVLVVSLLPTLWASRGEGMGPIPERPKLGPGQALRDFLRPLRGDFGWVILTRAVLTFGIYAILPFVQLYFGDVVGVKNPERFTAIYLVIVLVAATGPGIVGGWLSDRLGRKPFVYASGALMSLVAAAFVVVFRADPAFILALGFIFGIGYGLYYAVDWALACDTLPNRDSAAKDMGLFHVSLTLPQIVMPGIAGFALYLLNSQQANSGYRIVFGSSVVFFLAGTFFVSRIRSVR